MHELTGVFQVHKAEPDSEAVVLSQIAGVGGTAE